MAAMLEISVKDDYFVSDITYFPIACVVREYQVSRRDKMAGWLGVAGRVSLG